MNQFNPPNPMYPNNRLPAAIRGGVPLQKVPVIPWDAFVACGLHVYKDGKVQACLFDPQPMETADEAFQTLRLLMAAQGKKPGPIAWDSVPPEVQRHFRFESDDQPVIETG